MSNDGGKTFSPNFRVSDTTFNPNAGAFTDANGKTDDYLGDRIGVAPSNGIAYAVWTDTRNGSQDIYLQKYSLTLPPQPPLDRLYPNNTPATATALGPVTAQQVVPAADGGPGRRQLVPPPGRRDRRARRRGDGDLGRRPAASGSS